jgi:hypothetical protein
MIQSGGAFEALSLAWSVVEIVSDVIALGLGDFARRSRPLKFSLRANNGTCVAQ